MRDTRCKALKPLRDLIIVGNAMAVKLGQDPNNLANTWDEMVERLRASGILQQVAKSELVVEKVDAQYQETLDCLP